MKFPQDKGHNLRFPDGDTEYCAGCGRYTSTVDKARHSFWLRSRCTPVAHFNKKLLQGHVMRRANGAWYCETCGQTGRELNRPCKPPGRADCRGEPEQQGSDGAAFDSATDDFLASCGTCSMEAVDFGGEQAQTGPVPEAEVVGF